MNNENKYKTPSVETRFIASKPDNIVGARVSSPA